MRSPPRVGCAFPFARAQASDPAGARIIQSMPPERVVDTVDEPERQPLVAPVACDSRQAEEAAHGEGICPQVAPRRSTARQPRVLREAQQQFDGDALSLLEHARGVWLQPCLDSLVRNSRPRARARSGCRHRVGHTSARVRPLLPGRASVPTRTQPPGPNSFQSSPGMLSHAESPRSGKPELGGDPGVAFPRMSPGGIGSIATGLERARPRGLPGCVFAANPSAGMAVSQFTALRSVPRLGSRGP
jgi:hypothetical protein